MHEPWQWTRQGAAVKPRAMDLTYGERYEAFRSKVREFLEQHRDQAPPASMAAAEVSPQLRSWQQVLIEQGYAARTVPREYGGYGAAPELLETIIIEEEFRRARVSQGMENQGISMLVPTLLQYGI